MAKPIPCVDAVMTATFPSNNLFFSLPISRPHQSKRKKRKKITHKKKKKIKEKKIISASFCFRLSSSSSLLLRYHHLVPHRKPHDKTPRFVRT
jgi:hypothetical protein